MKWIKRLFIFIILLVAIYIVNYWRLSVLPPKQINYVNAIEANTKHYWGGQVFTAPKDVDLNTLWTRLSDDPYMGTHYISIARLLEPFNPKKPTGFVEYNRQVVAYFYTATDKEIEKLPYHWHYHGNLCYMEGLVATTELSPLQCVLHGYVWWPINKWMLHVWLIPNPNGQNDLFDPLLGGSVGRY